MPTNVEVLAGEVERLRGLLRETYSRVPEPRKGTMRCTNFDPAGSDYEFTESQWSVDARKALGIKWEPTGI